MEAKFLASVFSFLSIFLAIYAQSLVSDDEDSTEFEFETAIYYGDSIVNLGEPFSITCIIPITDPIFWIKDDEPITLHNLRHGHDEHSYMLSESAIEGEKHKIEAHLSVRHALKVHEGQYQCNNLHTSYHMLHVRSPLEVTKPQTKSPFIITADGNQLFTESGYETIRDLTPNSADDIFTRTWESVPEPPAVPPPPLPTQTTTKSTHHRQHHHHAPQQYKPPKEQHKFIYINSTNFDGSPRAPPSATGGESDESAGLVNLAYIPPTTKYNELTTVPWRSTTTLGVDRSVPSMRPKYPPPPQFPPPRTTMLSSTMVPPQPQPHPPPTGQYYTPNHHADKHNQHNQHNHVFTANNIHRTGAGGYDRFPLQTSQPIYYQQPTKAIQGTYQTAPMYPTQTQVPLLNPFQQYNQMQTYPPQQQQVPRLTGTSAATVTASSSSSSFSSHMPTVMTTTTLNMLQPKAIKPISQEPDFLVPNYDNVEHQLKVFEIRTPLVLSCNVTKEGDYELTWEKNGTDVSKVKELQGRHRIIAPERKFIIDRTDVHDDGLYSCVANNQKRDINVVARVVVRVPSNTGVVEGEKLSIVCTVVGTDPQLSWSIGNLTISNSTDRFILKPDDNHVQNAIFSVENISLDDRGEFKCIGRNIANDYTKFAEASDVSYVRVKGKLAALWPFLGICAEVLILCAIILIYEKRRNKTELEESDTDPQEQKKKRRNYE